jgi:hypothetical protein
LPRRGHHNPAPNRNGGTIIAKHAAHYPDVDATYGNPNDPVAYYRTDYYADSGTDHAGYSQFNSKHRAEPAHRKSGFLVPAFDNWSKPTIIRYEWFDAEHEPPC